ncbi:MAG TPA: class I SAM-dependent methyltransferase [Candidatus Nanoarchaeia archaeon]|nr:class I SAM-dependent methyltransferase [Candidatus Nanoarchaeia archaeon]
MRIPEIEIMDHGEEAEIYDQLSKKFLYWIEDAFVESVLNMGVSSGRVLDVGTGPGLIPIKISRSNESLEIIAADMSEPMLEKARENMKSYGGARVNFIKADAQELPFDNGYFDLVISHSLMHHLKEPVKFLDEIKRVAKKDGAILIRDIRRPPKILLNIWASIFGKGYTPEMARIYKDSLQAAYRPKELVNLVNQSKLDDVTAKLYFLTHIGLERHSPRKERNIIPLFEEAPVPERVRMSYISKPSY